MNLRLQAAKLAQRMMPTVLLVMESVPLVAQDTKLRLMGLPVSNANQTAINALNLNAQLANLDMSLIPIRNHVSSAKTRSLIAPAHNVLQLFATLVSRDGHYIQRK